MHITATNLTRQASSASELLKALADINYLMIARRLIEGDQCVGGFAVDLDPQQTLVLQRSAVLQRQRAVEAKGAGQAVICRLSGGVARAITEALAVHFCTIFSDTVRAS